jgi:hypothetical protein
MPDSSITCQNRYAILRTVYLKINWFPVGFFVEKGYMKNQSFFSIIIEQVNYSGFPSKIVAIDTQLC